MQIIIVLECTRILVVVDWYKFVIIISTINTCLEHMHWIGFTSTKRFRILTSFIRDWFFVLKDFGEPFPSLLSLLYCYPLFAKSGEICYLKNIDSTRKTLSSSRVLMRWQLKYREKSLFLLQVIVIVSSGSNRTLDFGITPGFSLVYRCLWYATRYSICIN